MRTRAHAAVHTVVEMPRTTEPRRHGVSCFKFQVLRASARWLVSAIRSIRSRPTGARANGTARYAPGQSQSRFREFLPTTRGLWCATSYRARATSSDSQRYRLAPAARPGGPRVTARTWTRRQRHVDGRRARVRLAVRLRDVRGN